MDQLFKSFRYLQIGAVLQRVAEVSAVDLAVGEKGAEAGVEDAGGGGEGEGPDLRLVPEVPDPTALSGASGARRAGV